MPDQPDSARYEWVVLQDGQLPLRPEGWVDTSVEHRSTAALIWPEGERPNEKNTLLVDPYFTDRGFEQAAPLLDRLALAFDRIGRMFVTHPHFDHCLQLPTGLDLEGPPPFCRDDGGPLGGLRLVPCPGHERSLHALAFTSSEGEEVWIVGDAVLDEPWLRAWGYYWPNGYSARRIVETWHSLATILSGADVVVPGHGPPIPVTPALVRTLLTSFPAAEHADQCPEVGEALETRLDALLDRQSAG